MQSKHLNHFPSSNIVRNFVHLSRSCFYKRKSFQFLFFAFYIQYLSFSYIFSLYWSFNLYRVNESIIINWKKIRHVGFFFQLGPTFHPPLFDFFVCLIFFCSLSLSRQFPISFSTSSLKLFDYLINFIVRIHRISIQFCCGWICYHKIK